MESQAESDLVKGGTCFPDGQASVELPEGLIQRNSQECRPDLQSILLGEYVSGTKGPIAVEEIVYPKSREIPSRRRK